jgi:uncharacterized protein (TIGR00369 family)
MDTEALESLRGETDIRRIIDYVFAQRIPFNQLIGLELAGLGREEASFRFPMREELVGNFVRRTLHGGVISAALDVTGGVVAFLGVLAHLGDKPLEERLARFSRLGTIDLRVDYLRPGTGRYFVSKGFLLRTGRKVAVARMELENDAGRLIAVGTGTYIVS